jgi:hypothetical protein
VSDRRWHHGMWRVWAGLGYGLALAGWATIIAAFLWGLSKLR